MYEWIAVRESLVSQLKTDPITRPRKTTTIFWITHPNIAHVVTPCNLQCDFTQQGFRLIIDVSQIYDYSFWIKVLGPLGVTHSSEFASGTLVNLLHYSYGDVTNYVTFFLLQETPVVWSHLQSCVMSVSQRVLTDRWAGFYSTDQSETRRLPVSYVSPTAYPPT